MARPSYYAITFINQTSWSDRRGTRRHGPDWYTLAGPCAVAKEAKALGLTKIRDEHRETELKNMLVVSKSQLDDYRLKPEVFVRW